MTRIVVVGGGAGGLELAQYAGDRWTTRLWGIEKWMELAAQIEEAGYYPLLLGGAQEHERNLAIQAGSGAEYLGHFGLGQFINLIDLGILSRKFLYFPFLVTNCESCRDLGLFLTTIF